MNYVAVLDDLLAERGAMAHAVDHRHRMRAVAAELGERRVRTDLFRKAYKRLDYPGYEWAMSRWYGGPRKLVRIISAIASRLDKLDRQLYFSERHQIILAADLMTEVLGATRRMAMLDFGPPTEWAMRMGRKHEDYRLTTDPGAFCRGYRQARAEYSLSEVQMEIRLQARDALVAFSG